MKVLGIAVKVNKVRSTSRLVVIKAGLTHDGSGDLMPQVLETFQVTGDDRAWAVHVASVGRAVRGHAQSIRPDAVVVRRADQSPHPRNSDGPRLRLLIEGGLLAACMDITQNVEIRTGQECSNLAKCTKEALDMRARSLVDKAYTEAAAAALSSILRTDRLS